MALRLGDTVVYKDESINGEYLQGEVVIVAKNNRGFIHECINFVTTFQENLIFLLLFQWVPILVHL